MSRRQIIGGLGVGLAAVAVAPVLAAQGTSNSAGPALEKPDNPTSKYPKPPFKGQSQPWPGLAGPVSR